MLWTVAAGVADVWGGGAAAAAASGGRAFGALVAESKPRMRMMKCIWKRPRQSEPVDLAGELHGDVLSDERKEGKVDADERELSVPGSLTLRPGALTR